MNPHTFELNRETRRMQCSACGGLMNECAVTCGGVSVLRRATQAEALADFDANWDALQRACKPTVPVPIDPFDALFVESFSSEAT